MRGERSRSLERIATDLREGTVEHVDCLRARTHHEERQREPRRSSMSRNWDIMRNAAAGADPYGNTRRMEQNRMRDRERWTSRDRQEGYGGARWFDGVPDYEQSRYNDYRQQQQRRGYIPSYGDEGFGRPSQGWGAQGYG